MYGLAWIDRTTVSRASPSDCEHTYGGGRNQRTRHCIHHCGFPVIRAHTSILAGITTNPCVLQAYTPVYATGARACRECTCCAGRLPERDQIFREHVLHVRGERPLHSLHISPSPRCRCMVSRFIRGCQSLLPF